jgi:hypothetical protein
VSCNVINSIATSIECLKRDKDVKIRIALYRRAFLVTYCNLSTGWFYKIGGQTQFVDYVVQTDRQIYYAR